MRRLLRSRAGFSLTELIISMLLSSFVMIGIVGIASQMVRFQVEGMKKGSVTGWSLVAITAMNREIEDGTTLVYPTNGTGAQDLLTICKNYTHITNAAMDSTLPIERISYCYDPTAPGYLRRVTSTGACPALGVSPGACTAGTYPEVVATGVYRDAAGNMVFRRADEVGGVQIRYRVGNPTPTANMPMPQSMAFDMKFAMNKQYNNTQD
jgi:hypothetical protein